MRPFSLLLLLASSAFALDPVTLHTEIVDGKSLSFRLENHYSSPVTKFEVAATNPEGTLGCSITAEVKRPEDLHPPGRCGFASKPDERNVRDTEWKTRIVYVEFADGMRWGTKK